MSRLSAIMTVALVASPVSAASPTTTYVIVNGAKYRVTVEGESVVVARKSLVVRYSVEERDAQRAAVVQATGCSVTDELPSMDARLRGKLLCPH